MQLMLNLEKSLSFSGNMKTIKCREIIRNRERFKKFGLLIPEKKERKKELINRGKEGSEKKERVEKER